MNDTMPTVGGLRRPVPPARSTAARVAPRPVVAADRPRTRPIPILRLLHTLTLCTLPLAIYLVYSYGSEHFGYYGLLAATIFGNLLTVARIDTAHQQEIKEQLNQIASTSQPDNHE